MYQDALLTGIDDPALGEAKPLAAPGLGLHYRARYGSGGMPVVVRSTIPGAPAGAIAQHLENHYRAALAAGASATPAPLYLGPHGNGIILVTQDRIAQTLADALHEGPLSVSGALEWTLGALRALKAFHRTGWLHRSLRPEHVGRDGDGTVLLIGLGNARAMKDSSQDRWDMPVVPGEMAYLAPEQTGRLDRPMDWRTDIFSLGAILYASLAGHPPFGGRDAPAILHECLTSIPPALSSIRLDVPQFVSDIASKAMTKNPDGRYLTLAGLELDLRLALSGNAGDARAGGHDSPEDCLFAGDAAGERGALGLGRLLQWVQDTFPDPSPDRENLAGALVASGVRDAETLKARMLELARAGDIAWDAPRGAWIILRSRGLGGIDDAFEALLPGRLATVEEDTVRFLECASCVGDEFDPQTVSAIVRSEDFGPSLKNALEAGLVIPSSRGGSQYRFAHPAIRKHLYGRLESIRRSAWHSAFAERYEYAGRPDLAVPHVLADPLKPRRRDELIRRAAVFREAALAIRPQDPAKALSLTARASSLLGGAGWRDAYRLKLETSMLFAALCAATGRQDDYERAAAELRSEARDADMPSVHRTLIAGYSALGRSAEAVDEGIAALRRLGCFVPSRPGPLASLLVYLASRSGMPLREKTLLARSPETPQGGPRVRNRETLEILLETGTSAYVSRPMLVPFMVAKGLRLAGRDSGYPGLAVLYAAMGYMECGLFRNYARGQRYGRLAESLAAGSLTESRYCQTMLITAGFVTHWARPLYQTLAAILDAARTGKTAGDAEFSSYSYSAYLQHLILEGRSLSLVNDSLPEIEKAVRSQGQELPTLVLDATLSYLNLMREGIYDKTAPVLRGKSLAQWQADMQKAGQHEVACDIALNRALGACTFGDFPEALAAIREAAPSRGAFAGQLADPVLTCLELVATLRLGRNPGRLMGKTRRWFRRLAALNPGVFESKALLVEAMHRFRQGGRSAAFDQFDKSIAAARATGNLLDEANTCAEYAWRLDKAGRTAQAVFQSMAAYDALVRWGAQGAALALSERSQRLRNWIHANRVQTGGLVGLDAEAVMEALSSMAGELDPARLARRLLELAQGLTGSRYGAVWLKGGDKSWALLAQEGREASVDPAVLEQAALSLRSVSGNRGPDGGSQTVVPLVTRGRALGALQLGNDLVSDAFPRERLAAVEIMTMQAAVALDNADLYSSLELKVKERTAELEDALRNVRRLQGLIPICSSCKKVRDDSGYWSQVEEYISARTEADFTHGLCPDCMTRYYDEMGIPAERRQRQGG